MPSDTLHRLVLVACLAMMSVAACPSKAAPPVDKTTTLQGEVLDDQNQPIAEAPCTLTGGLLPSTGITVTTDRRGKFRFLELPPAEYTLTCAAMGFRPIKKDLEVSHEAPFVQVILTPDKILRQSIEVHEKAPVLEQEQAATAVKLSAQELTDLPMAEQKFKAALPMIPGVLRTPDGRINIKGVPENQGLLLVDSAETVDPVTGSFAIDVPHQAIESLEVHRSAYRAEYGGASGGLTSIATKPPSSQWHTEIEDFTPNPRIKSGHLVGIANFNPRLYVTGPLVPGRLNFAEALGYDIDKQPVRGLAWPHNEIWSHDFNSFTTFQYVFSSRHLSTLNVNVFPLRREFADISSLIPQPASSNYGQRGFSVDFNDRAMTASGSVFTTAAQATKFDSNSYGQGAEDMLVTPNGWGGNFFNSFQRNSDEEELRETYDWPGVTWHGKHEWTTGGGVLRRAYDGFSHSHPVLVLRQDGSVAQRLDFLGTGQMQAQDTEGVLFAQDHWTLTERVAVDLGLRYSGQTVGSAANLGPRAGVVYS
ncbi:MAG: TonB-dependent receptor, partial [Acidobacteriia bacterium]|nr:TonB-dependent receptor [Terriglobia bacterium]